MSKSRGRLLVGTSGYQYDHWKGVFYPDDLPKEQWLAHYVDHFGTVEINNTFYGLPEPETFDTWRETAPEGFVFALKFSRYGTHMKALKDPEDTIPAFMEGAERLGDTLGTVLVQLRPNWNANPERLDAFLEAAPDGIRWAVEVRDESWLDDEVYDVLRSHGAALVIHDMIEDHPRVVTTDWTYLRFHGHGDYTGSYADEELDDVAEWISTRLSEGTDVYAYFNNDEAGHAVEDAGRLRERIET